MSTVGITTIDFGSGGMMATVTVAASSVTAGSFVEAFLMLDTTADHTPYEHLMAPIKFTCGNVIAGTSFDIFAVSSITLTGVWAVRWVHT